MSARTATLAGFRDPVHDAQRTFRAALDALARPGSLHPATAPAEWPACLSPAVAALSLTLLDHDTPVWLCPESADAGPYLRFHANVPVVASPAEAAFVIANARRLPALETLAQGRPDYPDRSATVLCELPALGDGRALRLIGPGVDGATVLHCRGLPADFPTQWTAQRARFPLGVDVLLAAGDGFCGLPRSVHIEEVEPCTSR